MLSHRFLSWAVHTIVDNAIFQRFYKPSDFIQFLVGDLRRWEQRHSARWCPDLLFYLTRSIPNQTRSDYAAFLPRSVTGGAALHEE